MYLKVSELAGRESDGLVSFSKITKAHVDCTPLIGPNTVIKSFFFAVALNINIY